MDEKCQINCHLKNEYIQSIQLSKRIYCYIIVITIINKLFFLEERMESVLHKVVYNTYKFKVVEFVHVLINQRISQKSQCKLE